MNNYIALKPISTYLKLIINLETTYISISGFFFCKHLDLIWKSLNLIFKWLNLILKRLNLIWKGSNLIRCHSNPSNTIYSSIYLFNDFEKNLHKNDKNINFLILWTIMSPWLLLISTHLKSVILKKSIYLSKKYINSLNLI